MSPTLERIPSTGVVSGMTISWTGLTIDVQRVDRDHEPGFVWVLGDVCWELQRRPPAPCNLQWCRIGVAETVALLP